MKSAKFSGRMTGFVKRSKGHGDSLRLWKASVEQFLDNFVH